MQYRWDQISCRGDRGFWRWRSDRGYGYWWRGRGGWCRQRTAQTLKMSCEPTSGLPTVSFIVNMMVVQEHVEPTWPWPYLNRCFKWHICSWWRTIYIEIYSKKVMVRTKIWSSSVTSIMGLIEWLFQMAHLQVMGNNCVKLFRNPLAIVEVMVRTNFDAC